MKRGQILAVLFTAMVSLAFHGYVAVAQTSGPRNHFTPQEIATDSCWLLVETGLRVETVPIGSRPSTAPGSSDPNQREIPEVQSGNGSPGRDFVRLPDGSWTDSNSKQPVSTTPEGKDTAGLDELGRISYLRKYQKVPCPLPENNGQTPAPGPPPPPAQAGSRQHQQPTPSAPAPPAQQSDVIQVGQGLNNPEPKPPIRTPTTSGLHVDVLASVGVIGSTAKYDDGFKTGTVNGWGTAGVEFDRKFFGLGVRDDVGSTGPHNSFSAGLLLEFEAPISPPSAINQTAETKLEGVGIYDIQGEIPLVVGVGVGVNKPPMVFYLQGGGAIGIVNVGATTPGYESDTHALPGFNFGGGLKFGISPRLKLKIGVDYTQLIQADYSQLDVYNVGISSISGGIGVEVRLK